MKKIVFSDDSIYGAVTLKDVNCPDDNNMALHVCNDPDGVLQNRQRLALETLPLKRWALPWQKHTSNFYEVTSNDLGRGAFDKETSIMDVDAVYTTEPEILIGVFTADCLGILVVDPTTPCVCAIHSGWKGTVQRIAHKTIKHLIRSGKIDPQSARVYFSPSLQWDSLELGTDVIDQLLDMPVPVKPFLKWVSSEKALFDNQGFNIKEFLDLGFSKENLYPSSYDTLTNTNDTFSYRKNNRLKTGLKCGEHFTFGYIKKTS